MTITLDLTSAEEERLKRKAASAGLDIADYVRLVLNSDADPFYNITTDPAYSGEWTEEDLADARAMS